MSKYSVALCVVVLVAFIPMSASADSAKVRHLANLAIDSADEMLLAAGQLFHDQRVAGEWYPAVLNGDEMVKFGDREMTCSQWIELANQVYEQAWDNLLDGHFSKSIRQSHRTIVIAKLLVEKAERLKLAYLAAK